jgi:hypothetical protein
MNPTTVTILLSLVPEYLQSSELYRTLLQNRAASEDETLALPHDCMKPSPTVNDNESLKHVLTTAQYWAVDELPDVVYDFVINSMDEARPVVRQFSCAFPIFTVMLDLSWEPSAWLTEAAKLGNLSLMKYLRRKGYNWHRECAEAAQKGHLDCLKYAHQNGCSLDADWPCACEVALEGGHFACFEYARENRCFVKYRVGLRTFSDHRNADCLKYVVDHADLFEAVAHVGFLGARAIALRSIYCIDKLRQMGWDWECDDNVYSWALTAGDAEIIAHVLRNGCWLGRDADQKLLDAAQICPELTPLVVTFLLLLLVDRGSRVCAATLTKLIDMEADHSVLRAIITRRSCSTMASATAVIARLGYVELLELAFLHGFQPGAEVCQVALERGDLSMLRCAVTHGCGVPAPAVAAALIAAARENDLVKLQYLQRLMWREAVSAAAESRGYDCVQYLQRLQLFDESS